MAKANLAGVRAKINRANQHFEHINATVKSFLGPEDYTQEIAGHQFHREIQQLIVKAKAGKAIDPTLGLVIGDCVHNLRSALDHLVLQLAILNGTFAGAERKTAFPICLDRGAFKHAVKNNVAPFISRTALDAIEESQPYRTLDPATNIPLGDQSVLWVLSQLDVIDKHRVILIAAPQVAAEGFTIHGPGGEMYQTPILPVKWKPLKDGEEIIRFDFKNAFHQAGKTRVIVEFATVIHFIDSGLFCDGRGVQDTLDNSQRVVTYIVDDFGKRFFGE